MTCSVSFLVTQTAQNSWKTIPNGSGSIVSSFLSSFADLNRKQPEQLTSPTEFDQVTARTMSEESRINGPNKVVQLLLLRGDVYKTEPARFCWNLGNALETTYQSRHITNEDVQYNNTGPNDTMKP